VAESRRIVMSPMRRHVSVSLAVSRAEYRRRLGAKVSAWTELLWIVL